MGSTKGFLTEKENETMYCIENFDLMDPFLMSILSGSDLWMYLSASGCLTAGRKNYNNALFPYETDDKLHESAGLTGPKTIVRIKNNNGLTIWTPFTCDKRQFQVSRNIYKNLSGNKVIFEEINHSLNLVFSYSWTSSDYFGWIRKSELKNLSGKTLSLDITDGLMNVLPWGITRQTQSMMSTLMDAYKVGEFLPKYRMALFYMSSIPVDRAEPAEALRTNTVWTHGLSPEKILLSHRQLKSLADGNDIQHEAKSVGQKNAFLIHSKLTLDAEEVKNWFIVLDVAKDSSEVLSLQNHISGGKDIIQLMEQDVNGCSQKIHTLVSLADGIQVSGDKLNDRRHFSNVLFNIMRGGIFASEYSIELYDFLEHLSESNKEVFNKYQDFFHDQGEVTNFQDLYNASESRNDNDLLRLCLEYLPLSFSRRHGDPSRPWNFFEINSKNPDGSASLNYQGNWRDIFQNWEALGFSFPGYLSGMISRFLNASTADGYNPYRITRQGFDWEVPEPDNPWASIGYWGDHQIIYLLKLMELHEKFFPGKLSEYFNRPLFVYARVPYRIKSYYEILQNPSDTIIFEKDLHDQLLEKYNQLGNDGKLMQHPNGEILKAGFIEKILVSLLTKLSNFVPQAGIWLNTQRPEWNDANNALTGLGTSMVSLYYIRRYVDFLCRITKKSNYDHFVLAAEVNDFFEALKSVYFKYKGSNEKGFSDASRNNMVDELGTVAEQFRNSAYKGFSGRHKLLPKGELLNCLYQVLEYCDQSISYNRRSDGLYHSYNLLEFESSTIKINNLYLMLEGQVAILSSGQLKPPETLKLLEALFKSNLWRDDQQSFLLYPFRNLPGFLDKNIIPGEIIDNSKLLTLLIQSGNTSVVKQDDAGNYHFNANLKNSQQLKEALKKLNGDFDPFLIRSQTDSVLNAYESVFNHRCFTGRSGSFYKYEGLGSIYWHMVSKLLLAVGETIVEFSEDHSYKQFIPELKSYYYKIKEGLGIHKKPEDYGAFPTDPYSHTPLMMGAQQPGMTGQVKEDILSRFNELGVVVKKGKIIFCPALLTAQDFGTNKTTQFTFCGTEFILQKSEEECIEVVFSEKACMPVKLHQYELPQHLSEEIFLRKKTISQVVIKC